MSYYIPVYQMEAFIIILTPLPKEPSNFFGKGKGEGGGDRKH
jgi:hypothetical protein